MQRYVDECLKGSTGDRGKDFNMRWIASLVAEAHRILMRGGVFMYPRDTKKPGVNGRLRLMYECNPISLLMEQAGGRASTGYKRMLDVKPEVAAPEDRLRVRLALGSRAHRALSPRRRHARQRTTAVRDARPFPNAGVT